MRRMQALDNVFLQAETPTMPLHVLGALVFDPSEATEKWGYDTVVRLLSERLHMIPPLRWRAVDVPANLDRGRWIEDPDFRLTNHVHKAKLAKPADLDALAAFVGEVAATPLDRNRPLWEMFVIEKMADGSTALVAKLHHAFMDGGVGMEVIGSLFDLDPSGGSVPEPEEPWKPDEEPSRLSLLAQSPLGTISRIAGVPHLLKSTAKMVSTSIATRGELERPAESPRGPMAPSTPLNGSLTSERAMAFSRCSLDEIRRIKGVFGVTVNDVMLAAATSTLRSELRSRDALPDGSLVGMIPISERPEGDMEFSNRTASMTVGLPVHIADPVERLELIHEMARAAKERYRVRGAGVLEEVAGMFPPWLVSVGAGAFVASGLANSIPPAFNVIISNIPGPPIPLYLAGAKVTHLYPMGPLFETCGVNITLISHDGFIDVGVLTCPAQVDDPTRLSRGFTAAIDELGELATRLG